jgi:hypothetical protein
LATNGRSQPADVFVFHPRAVANPPGVKAGLRGVDAHAERVAAMLVFGSDLPF